MEKSNIIKGLAKREFYTAGVQPVYGGYYSFIDEISPLKTPPPWGRLPHAENHGGLIHSTRLRYTVRALRDTIADKPRWELTAVTVDLSTSKSEKLSGHSQGPVTAYGSSLRARFKRHLSLQPEFIAVIEEAGGKLHAHLLIGHAKGQLDVIRKLLDQDASPRTNRVLTRKIFRELSQERQPGIRFRGARQGAGAWQFPHMGTAREAF